MLGGGNMGGVVRRGRTVLRPSGPWTPAVHRLLSHLREAGVSGIPAPVGRTDDGREILTFVPGNVPSYPMPGWVWTRAALESASRLLRKIHDATAGADIAGPWRSPSHRPVEVICHNDFATYNLVFSDTEVVGAIDWDFASPGPRVWDLAYLAYRIVPLTTEDWGDGFTAQQREGRLELLLDAYGTAETPGSLLTTLRQRLLELAAFSDDAAARLGNPELATHAALYRRDAAHLGTRKVG